MTTEQTIFADQANDVAPAEDSMNQQPEAPAFTLPTEVVDYIGDGKKYKSVEDALKSVPHAQNHIKTLEDELRAVKEELQRRKSAEEVLEMSRQETSTKQETPVGVNIDQDALSSIVERVLDKKTQEEQAKANVSIVTSRLEATYGDKAEQMYKKIATENGLSIMQLNQLSMTSPSVVLKLAGVEMSKTKATGLHSTYVAAPNNNVQQQFNTSVKIGATTKDVIAAFAEAGRKVQANLDKG